MVTAAPLPPNAPGGRARKTKRKQEMWECYALRYAAKKKRKGKKKLKASIQITKSGCIGAENALLVPLPLAIMTLLYQMASQSQMFPLCVI